MKKLILIAALISPAQAQAITRCDRMAAVEQCTSATEKIKVARCELLRRNICDWRADLAYVYSIDENEGRFKTPKALAIWIECGDGKCF